MRDEHLHALVADGRLSTAVDVRKRRRSLAAQLAEDGTFGDAWEEAVRAAASVDVVVHGGRIHRGRPGVRGVELFSLATSSGVTYLRPSAVVGLRLRAARSTARVPDLGGVATMREALSSVAEDGATVAVGVGCAGVHHGRVDQVGRDVVGMADGQWLRLDQVTDMST